MRPDETSLRARATHTYYVVIRPSLPGMGTGTRVLENT